MSHDEIAIREMTVHLRQIEQSMLKIESLCQDHETGDGVNSCLALYWPWLESLDDMRAKISLMSCAIEDHTLTASKSQPVD